MAAKRGEGEKKVGKKSMRGTRKGKGKRKGDGGKREGTRVNIPTAFIFFVFVLPPLPRPRLPFPAFSLDSGSERTISSEAVGGLR